MKKVFAFLGVFLLLWSGSVFAYPVLQLDIGGGEYYSSSASDVYDPETIIYPGIDGIFTVYALLTPRNSNSIGDYVAGSGYDAYLSIAVFPQVSVGTDLGSITVNGSDYNVTGDMVYGTPPREMEDSTNDLQSHGVFDTYYMEVGFDWNQSQTAVSYNTQDIPGGLTTGSGDTYYMAFDIDASGLSELYSLHFDLYSADLDANGKMDYVAPFSHDAQSTPVPEPATMLLLGSGLFGLAGVGKKKIKNNLSMRLT